MTPVPTSPHRPGSTLYRYLVSGMILPTCIALAGLTLVVLTKEMLGYADLVINRGLSASFVAGMAFLEAVPLASQLLPFSALIGALVALGRLVADREALLLEASGVSPLRLVGPTLLFGAAAGVAALGLSLFAGPWANRSLDSSLDRLARTEPAAAVLAGRVSRFAGWRLEASEVTANGESMKRVLLWVPEIGETVFARSGALAPDQRGGSRLILSDGIVFLEPRRGPRLVHFANLAVVLPSRNRIDTRDWSRRLRGDSLAALRTKIHPRGVIRYDANRAFRADVEFQRRFALPAATLVFAVLAIPLVFGNERFSRARGGIAGVLVTLVYYGLTQLGEGLASAGWLRVWQGVWLPNALLGAAACFLLVRFARLSGSRNRRRRRGNGKGAVAPAFGRAERPAAEIPELGGQSPSQAKARRWPLQRDVTRRFLKMTAICFALILVAYLLVDILEKLDWMSQYRASPSAVLRYYAARLPLLASRVLPMALLAATALTVSLLAVRGELVGMRAAGVPLARALAPILILCALMVPAHFVLSDSLVPRANAWAAYVKKVVIKGLARKAGPQLAAWYRIGERVYEAESLDVDAGSAGAVTVYELGSDGFPVSRSDAKRAWHVGGGIWRLEEPVRTEIVDGIAREVSAHPFLELGEAIPAEVDTRRLSAAELRAEIREVEAGGYAATILWVDYWAKLAAPIACLLLPALALFFSVAGPPYPTTATTLVASVVTSACYILLTGVGISFGYGGILAPFPAGFAPVLIFGIASVTLGLRLRGPR